MRQLERRPIVANLHQNSTRLRIHSPTEWMLKVVVATTGGSLPRNDLHSIRQRREPSASRRSSVYEQKVCRALLRWLRRPLWAWWDRVMMVLAPDWPETTILVWLAWFAMSLGPSM
jgi:hypothetical protein